MMASEEDEETGNALVSFVNDHVLTWVGKGQADDPLLNDVDLEEPADDDDGVEADCTRAKLFSECVLAKEITASVGVVLLIAIVCGVVLISVGHKLGSAAGAPATKLEEQRGGTVQIDIDIFAGGDAPAAGPPDDPGPGPPDSAPGVLTQ